MKRILLDEGVPKKVALYLPGYDVADVHEAGWDGVKNGRLLALIEKAGYDAFISNDKRIEFEQDWSKRSFATLLLSTNHWGTLEPNLGNIALALEAAKPGEVTRVDVGRFLPRKFRGQTPSCLSMNGSVTDDLLEIRHFRHRMRCMDNLFG